MPTPTYDFLTSVELSSPASSVTFSSLDTLAAGYRDLIMVVHYTATSANHVRVRLNSDSGGNYIFTEILPTTSGISAATGTTRTSINANNNTIAIGNTHHSIWNFMDFSVAGRYKTVLMEADDPQTSNKIQAARWNNTSAITTIDILAITNTYPAGAKFSLWGLVG